jgi:hypothetical protein
MAVLRNIKNRLIGANTLRKMLVLLALTLSASSLELIAQTGPMAGLYQILSGTYIECCGIAGEFRYELPNTNQSFVRMDVDPQSHLATMTFLGEDMQSVFSIIPCPSGPPIPFTFSDGFSSSGRTVFLVDPGPPPYAIAWNYSVENSTDRLQIAGTLGMVENLCADVPTRFTHTNIVAVLMPTASIRVSAIDLCWSTASNRTYQVQYRSNLTTNTWTDLGSPRVGDGSTNCLPDNVLPGAPQRFYRVVVKP